MEVIPKDNVLKRLRALVDKHGSQVKAARAIGCSPTQLNQALADRIPLNSAMLRALRIARAPLYVTGVPSVPKKFLDGSGVRP